MNKTHLQARHICSVTVIRCRHIYMNSELVFSAVFDQRNENCFAFELN